MTANFRHPFQCIRYIERSLKGFKPLLVASAGSRIYTYSAETGQRLSVWPRDPEQKNEKSSKTTGADSIPEDQGPPEKKRKITQSGDDLEESKDDAQSSGDHQNSVNWSNIPLLALTSNGDYLVAITAEDKCIRVLEIGEDGILQHLSERSMPKRPSSIALTSDDSSILCADKFGDVYSLPLLPGEQKSLPKPQAPGKSKPFKPAATTLTVHTKRNLQALQQQLKHSNKIPSGKSTPSFELNLLLGHVSMLTDLAFASLQLNTPNNRARHYILTADRDEHIRVSRGPSQAHIIENYCLGHTSFVSKLCIPRWAPEILVSGGGDNYILIWRWVEGRVLQKVPLVNQEQESIDITVRGIWAVSFPELGDTSMTVRAILVALDGSPRLLYYSFESDDTLKPQGFIQLSGNVLDVTSNEAKGAIFVSVDCVREVGSMQSWRTSSTSNQTVVESFIARLGQETLEWEPVKDSVTTNINSEGTSEIPASVDGKQQKELNESLYSLGNLRKKAFTDE